MKKHVVHIVESVIEITQHRERELVGNSLVRTLSEIIGSDGIILYQIQKTNDPIALSVEGSLLDPAALDALAAHEAGMLPQDLSDGIIRCMHHKAPVDLDGTDGGACRTIFPVIRSNQETNGFLVVCHNNNIDDLNRLVIGYLKIYQNFLSLLEESQSDQLTRLLNRQTFDRHIMRIVENPICRSSYVHLYGGTVRRIPDEHFKYYLAIIDIDNFKRVNDSFGHVYGDEVLILVARLMRSSFRCDDLLFRYGGEEFIVLLKAPSQNDANIALERFRTMIEKHAFPQVGEITVSIGYVTISKADVPVVVLGRADQALYYAKEHGKNRTCSYEDLTARGELRDVPIRIGTIELFTSPRAKQQSDLI
jgi:diguanylate cyclase (GGDEF)-like protein